ncbi:hypothetical protein ACQJBY_042716 [Aegilops geniculata]
MSLTDKDLKPSSTVFHGVVPGNSAYPVGKISLEVAFDDETNYRAETLWFELKMPVPEGTITVHGNHKLTLECEEGNVAYAESACAMEELKYYKDNIDQTNMSPLKNPTTETDPPLKFKSAKDTQQVDFIPGDSSQQFTFGTGMDPK